jgi:tripartite-type tricarboxylate transporter receptor subunit TctC
MRKTLYSALGAVAVAMAVPSAAQSFPDKPIQLVVPFAPGGATDLIARRVASEMSQTLGQPVVVENKAGASGAIGSTQVAQSKPDGYTLLLGVTTTHGINPVINKRLNYNPVNDFTPISLIATMPMVLVVNADSPAKSLDDFKKLAKESKPPLAFGSAGEGSPQHLAGEMLKNQFDFEATHVPYKGGNPALNDLVGGQIQFVIAQLAEAKPFVDGGRLRAIAVAAQDRIPGFDVPTFAELGKPFKVTAWYAMFAPANLPADVTKKINAAVVKAANAPEVQATFKKLEVNSVGSSSEELSAHIKNELEFWTQAVKTAGVEIQQ